EAEVGAGVGVGGVDVEGGVPGEGPGPAGVEVVGVEVGEDDVVHVVQAEAELAEEAGGAAGGEAHVDQARPADARAVEGEDGAVAGRAAGEDAQLGGQGRGRGGREGGCGIVRDAHEKGGY